MRDPEYVEELALMPDPEPQDMPLEGFTPLMGQIASLQDLIWMLIYVTARADPSKAPKATRPVYPHVKRRDEVRRGWLRSAVSKLIGGD